MELVVPIAANVVLGLMLLAIFAGLRARDPAGLAGPDEALALFRQRFPDASGTASVSADGRSALIALPSERAVGLLHRRGRRWNARQLLPEDLRAAHCLGDAIVLTFADFGWARIRVPLADAEARALWLARLDALIGRRGAAHA
jgi:hypothetical protein